MNKRFLIVVGVTIALIALGVAYYAISPLFRSVRLEESVPLEVMKPVEADKILKERISPVVGTTRHPASGNVRVINTKDGAIIRYENFKTLNGPDLYVYLSNDLDATDFVNLGLLRATEGNVNYSVPTGVDVTKYKYVLIWCKIFGILFNSAEIN